MPALSNHLLTRFFLSAILILLCTKVKAINSSEDTLTITVHAINLSEDMSTLSSKNDEVLLLIYSFDDTIKLNTPLLNEYFVMDSINRKKEMSFFVSYNTHDLLLLLAELDTEREPDQVEKLIRKNFKEIMDCINKRDLIAIKKYIGDDDILGIRMIKKAEHTKGITFPFQGRFKLDKYLYKIELKRQGEVTVKS